MVRRLGLPKALQRFACENAQALRILCNSFVCLFYFLFFWLLLTSDCDCSQALSDEAKARYDKAKFRVVDLVSFFFSYFVSVMLVDGILVQSSFE